MAGLGYRWAKPVTYLDKESVKLVDSGDDDGRLLAGLQKPEVERVNREHP